MNFADRIRAPIIILQGLEDAVVPPQQSEVVVAALRANRVPFAYLAFEGEQHGFRKAETLAARDRGRAVLLRPGARLRARRRHRARRD